MLNGQLLDAAAATVPISDRGFLYGDGVFETLRGQDGKLVEWPAHWARFQKGAARLGITIPCPEATLLELAHQLLKANQLTTALLRIQLTRGSGPRGYSPKNAGPPTLALTAHEAPGLPETNPLTSSLITATIRIPADDPLTGIKTCNRLPYILARAQADAAGADEAVLLNSFNNVACASAANLFCIQGKWLFTPGINSGALAGVTRALVMQLAKSIGLTPSEFDMLPKDLLRSDAVFLTQSSRGIVEVTEVDQKPIARSPLTTQIYQAWRKHILAP